MRKFRRVMAHTQQIGWQPGSRFEGERGAVALRETARRLARRGDDRAARAAYLRVLQADPSDHDALVALGSLAAASGYHAASFTVFAQAVRCYPHSAIAHAGLAQALIEARDFVQATRHGEIALRLQPGMVAAHRALARSLDAQGDPRASAHRYLGYHRHAVAPARVQAAGQWRVLLLVAARGGNISVQGWFDPARWAVTAMYADYLAPDARLPPHDLVVNAIGDADDAGCALNTAIRLIGRSGAPVVNRPDAVQATGREAIARRLARLPGVITPRLRTVSRDQAAKLTQFPVLLRAPGYHSGQYFERADDQAGLCQSLDWLPGATFLAMDYADTRGGDGFWRKYRVLIIDGVIYPVHLAISDQWKVHYFSAAMAAHPAHRAEERRFLDDMAGVLGTKAMAALAGIGAALGLDYLGVDFACGDEGMVLVFEANATMLAHPPSAEPIWDYRRPAFAAIARAIDAMLVRRCPVGSAC